jgi:hypothetical protein
VILAGILLTSLIVAGFVAVLGFWRPGFFRNTTIDIQQVQEQTAGLLSDEVGGYGPGHIRQVVCNNGRNPTAANGATFTCQFTVDGVSRHLVATFEGNDGDFRLGIPQ